MRAAAAVSSVYRAEGLAFALGLAILAMGAMGGFGANQLLRQQLANVNMSVLQQPEIYIGSADKIFDGDGGVTVESTEAFLRSYLASFASRSDRLTLAA